MPGVPGPCPQWLGEWGRFCSGWGSGAPGQVQSQLLTVWSAGLSPFPRAQQFSGTTSCGVGKATTERGMLPAPCLWAASGVSGVGPRGLRGPRGLGLSVRAHPETPSCRQLLPDFHRAKTISLVEVFGFSFFFFKFLFLLTGSPIQPCSSPLSWVYVRKIT